MCLAIVYFVLLILKHYHPNLVNYSSTTLYSLPLNLLKQLNINFSTFHLLIISISVLQYFLRYYRLFKNSYSRCFFNEQNLLLNEHTNVALILSGSLALIFAYNFVFYNSTESPTISFLPLITFNMILLPLINLLILLFILICLLINFFFESNFDNLSIDDDDEQETLRLIIERNTCIKCYSKILQKNPNLFQDKNYSYRSLYKDFFSINLRSSYPFQIKRNYFSLKKKISSQINLSNQQDDNQLLNRRTLTKLNHQHSLCHLCYHLLLIFLLKYILFTFPQHLIEMYLYSKHFHYFILKKAPTTNLNQPFYENYKYLLQISHFLFLSSRFGDSLLLIRLRYLIKKYFPCWCQFNSKLLRQKQIPHQILATKHSESSNNEPISPSDQINSNERDQQQQQQKPIDHRRFRLQFQFMPLWSRNRPRLFRESV